LPGTGVELNKTLGPAPIHGSQRQAYQGKWGKIAKRWTRGAVAKMGLKSEAEPDNFDRSVARIIGHTAPNRLD
jgi:hypothetical protein